MLEILPAELVVLILANLDNVTDVLNAGLTCKPIYASSGDNAIWIHLARQRFKYWETQDHSTVSLSWRTETKRRYEQARLIDETVSSLIDNSDYLYIPRFEKVLDMGVEAKDQLLKHIQNTPDDAWDVLARRYWSRQLFGAYQQRTALNILAKVHNGDTSPLERVYTALEMLIAQAQIVDIDQTTSRIDKMSDDFKRVYGEWKTLAMEDLIHLAAKFLVETKNFNGPYVFQPPIPVTNYFISRVLADPGKGGSSLVYVIIFCAFLGRIGVDAKLVALSGRFYVLIEQLNDNLYYDFYNIFPGFKTANELLLQVSDSEKGEITTILPKQLPSSLYDILKLPDLLGPWNITLSSTDIKETPFSNFRRLLALVENPEKEAHNYSCCFKRWTASAECWHVYSIDAFICSTASPRWIQSSKRMISMCIRRDAYPQPRKGVINPEEIPDQSRLFRIGDCVSFIAVNPTGRCVGYIFAWTQRESPADCSKSYSYLIHDNRHRSGWVEENYLDRVYSLEDICFDSIGRYFLRWNEKEKRFISNRKNFFPIA